MTTLNVFLVDSPWVMATLALMTSVVIMRMIVGIAAIIKGG